MISIEQKGRTKGDKEMSSFYFKTKKRMIAWICAITMVVAGLAVAPKTVVADEEAGTTAVDWSNITEWTRVGETDIYYSITNAKGMFNRVNVVNSELFYFVTNKGGFTATITGPKTDDVVEKTCNGAEIELKKSDFPTDGYYTIDTTKLDGLQIAVKRDSSGGGEVSAPKAPTGLEAHIGGGNTFYTIAFAPVDGAKSYKFYLDGKCIKEITNGGTVTIEELGLKAGKTYKFGVSAVNAEGGESDITTIDVTAPGKEEGTTPTPETDERTGNIVQGKSWKVWTSSEGDKGFQEISSDATNYTLQNKNIGSTWWNIQTMIEGVTLYANTEYVCTFTLKADEPKAFTVDNQKDERGTNFVESNGKGWQKAEDGTYFYKYKGIYTNTNKQDFNLRVSLGYHAENDQKKMKDSNYSANDIATFKMSNFQIVKASEYKDVTYTVSIDGKEETYEKGDSISVPTEGQGYYDVTKKVAYAPGTVLTVNENMTLKSIELNVTMTPGASIRLAAPTGLRFQTTVTSGNDIAVDDILDLTTGTVTTGTLITTRRLYEANDNTLTKDSDYNFLNIENDGWFNDGTKTTTGKFCGSIVRIKAGNYDREFIAVGYATINYSNGDPKTVYAEVTVNNAKSIQYVAKKVQASEKFSGYTAKQKAIINKYIDGKEISE